MKLFDDVNFHMHEEASRLLFNVLAAFIVTFVLAHVYSLLVPWYVFIAGYHIHHFYHGMVLLAISAIVGIVTINDKVRHFFSYVVGIGIGLIIDELGLLLSCTGERIDISCRYFFPSRFDAVAIVSAILLIFIFFGDKPIHWFLPKSWHVHPAMDKSVGQHVTDLGKAIGKKITNTNS
ncbi:MAG: hypothetical protein R3B52_02155 [Candidatus Paceibacterota bacterium]